MTRGRFVVLEGLDGSGTTTQVSFVAARLADAGVTAHVTANPSQGPLGIVARDFLSERVPLSERVMAMVFSGDRLDHYEREVAPLLEAGEWVICDRFYLSTLTYQAVGMSAREADIPGNMAWVYELNRHVARPDLTVSLEVDRDERERRIGASAGHRERYDLGEAADRLDASYRRAINFLMDRGEEFVSVQAGGRPPDDIADEITAVLLDRWAS